MPAISSVTPPADHASAVLYDVTLHALSAAQRVYEVPELRRMILTLLDRKTLILLLTLSRSVTTSIADVLYANKIVSAMEAKSHFNDIPRRVPHRAAIRHIDASLPAELYVEPEAAELDAYYLSNSSGRAFNPYATRFKALMNQFHNLRTIYWLQPTEDREEIGTIHLSYKGDNNTIDFVEVQSTVNIDIDENISPFAEPPTLPEPPSFPNVSRVHHTICLRFVHAEPSSHAYDWLKHTAERVEHMSRWRDWLVNNPKLDRRICGIDMSHVTVKTWAQMSLQDLCDFVADRKYNKCVPWSVVSLEADNQGTLEDMSELATQLGKYLRCLKLDAAAVETAGGLQAPITLFDAVCPFLWEVEISFDSSQRTDCIPLFGLSRVHLLTMTDTQRHVIDATDVYLLGVRDCVVRDGNIGSKQAAISLHRKIERLRSSKVISKH